MEKSAADRQALVIVAVFVCLIFAPFLGKAYHIDEPWFMDAARCVLRNPVHPFDADYSSWGETVSMSRTNHHPPAFYYFLALVLSGTGGGEFATRLAFLPLDAAAALALYLLAARFLSRPLLPTLIVLACPAYWINMNHLMAEKLVALFGFWGLYAMVRGVDEKNPRLFWLSAALLDAAMLSKLNAGLFLLPAAGYGLHRGLPRRRLWAYAALSLAGPAAWLLGARWAHHGEAASIWEYAAGGLAAPWSSWSHKLRSLLSFTGGCGLVTAIWPFLAEKPRGWRGPALLAAVLLLFAPFLDLGPVVRPADRLCGIVFSCGAAWGFWRLFSSLKGAPAESGQALWASWVLSVLAWLCVYWSISARMVLFLLPPLVFGMAQSLESRLPARRLRRLYAASLAGVAAASLCLNAVDYRYASVQKELARKVARQYSLPGRRLWCNAVGALRYYLEEAGARDLDKGGGGWAQVRRGDVVVMSRLWSGLRPGAALLANVRTLRADCAIPLRLISLWTGEGGFYSNVWGFLPYSWSREPLDEFSIVEAL